MYSLFQDTTTMKLMKICYSRYEFALDDESSF